MIEWNGIRSDALNVIVEQYPHRTFAKKKINVYSVPGRTGDIVDDEQAFENYTQEYNVFIEGDEVTNLPLRSRAIANWLMEPNGYAVLRDSYDINSFRYAYFEGPMDIETWFNIHGQATISFVCDPHRYLDDGQKNTVFNDTGYIINPTSFIAKPLISISGEINGSGIVIVGNKGITVNEIIPGMTVDCLTGQCYNVAGSLNDRILCRDFPVLERGSNLINFDGDITSVSITPRWWTL